VPRRLRIHVHGGFYHVTLRGNHQRAIFFAESDPLLLNDIVARALQPHQVRLHAYCWMTNHIHLLLQVNETPLGCFMRQVASEFARRMQWHLPTSGHFFERRYHATLVDTDVYLKALVRYIHLNPVEAGLCADPAEYRWSSHHEYLGDRQGSWITTDFVLREFGSTRRAPWRRTVSFSKNERRRIGPSGSRLARTRRMCWGTRHSSGGCRYQSGIRPARRWTNWFPRRAGSSTSLRIG
jgi:REP element-mobilizing transposase RayT